LTLDKHADSIKPGDKVLLTSIGAGWTWGSVVLEW
jgi:3-oxoacyl-[acyl-carrier-protein] synthase III